MKTPAPTFASRSGVALVMTIIILALITIMVLGFADLVRYETVSSSTHHERGRAQFLSQTAVDTVVGVLRKQTANPDLIWASKPGALVVPEEADPTHLTTQVDLHSGYPTKTFLASVMPTGPDEDEERRRVALRPANLNIQTLADQEPPTHLISDKGAVPGAAPGTPAAEAVKLYSRWVYVRQDGTVDYAEDPAVGTANPVTGRYAYWTDDESSKININTAWKRNPLTGSGTGTKNPYSASHPTSVNLSALEDVDDPTRGIVFTQKMADGLHSYITSAHNYTDLGESKGTRFHRFFNSLYEMRSIDALGDIRAVDELSANTTEYTKALNAYKFELTHYNHDPDTTFFNEPRLVLTTQKKYARGRPFLDILHNPGTDLVLGADPGRARNVSPAKLSKVIGKLLTATSTEEEKKAVTLMRYLQRDDWPMVKAGSGSSLQKKYYGTAKADAVRLTQIAVNIVDYVRCAESSMLMVEPTRGIVTTSAGQQPGFSADVFVPDYKEDGSERSGIRGVDMTYKGLTRSLFFTEMAIYVKASAETDAVQKSPPPPGGTGEFRYKIKFFVEMHLPENGGVEELDLLKVKIDNNVPALPTNTARLWIHCSPVIGANAPNDYWTKVTATNPSPTKASGCWFQVKAENIVGLAADPTKRVMKKGEFRTLVFEMYRDQKAGGEPRPTTFSAVRYAAVLFGGAPNMADDPDGVRSDPNTMRFEVSPVSNGNLAFKLKNGPTDHGINTGQTPEVSIGSFAVDDPWINGVTKDWRPVNTNSLAYLRSGVTGENSSATFALGKKPGVAYTVAGPEQDTDKDGVVTDIGASFPTPAKSTNNPKGVVYSPGELGHIHTGVEIRNTFSVGGVPWRTLRLQPSKDGNDVVPDWAFMDLFTVPVDSPTEASDMFSPHDWGTGGRVNINSQVEPFGNKDIVTQEDDRLVRRLPLLGVTMGAPTMERKSALTYEKTVIDTPTARKIAQNIYNRKWKTATRFGKEDIFDSPGEVVEIEGVADGGEESEALVRSIGNLVSTRGNVFNVYSIGQTMRETRNGDLLVTAEQRNQTILERYVESDDMGTPLDTTDDVKRVRFRNVIARNLTP